MVVPNATPLIALDAVVIDTETTGLDPADARIVEVGAVRIQGGRILDGTYSHLVRPGIPIPKASTAIHHIDDSKVAGAPTFAEIWPEMKKLIGESIVIGHTIGFDLAVLEPSNGRHLGLVSMRERAAEIGGSLDLHSCPGQGTEVVVVVPRA